jgi:hypothetical protein
VLAGIGVAAVAAAGVLAVLLTNGGGHAASAHAARHRTREAAGKRPVLPAVPVAVLNASSAPDAARRLALRLRADGVRIAAVGNLAESRPPGLWLLYAPGERTEAVRLARLLPGSPMIAPVDPVAQSAAGGNDPVVVVIA